MQGPQRGPVGAWFADCQIEHELAEGKLVAVNRSRGTFPIKSACIAIKRSFTNAQKHSGIAFLSK